MGHLEEITKIEAWYIAVADKVAESNVEKE
jgi:hypothetical protein